MMKCHPLNTVCPNCGRANNHITESWGGAEKAFPTSGDYSICIRCCTVAEFVNGPFGLTLRQLTAAEEIVARLDPAVREAIEHLGAD